MARAALNWSLADLAEAAGVHRNTISNFETGKYGGSEEALAAIRAALEAAGIEFTNGNAPGVRCSGWSIASYKRDATKSHAVKYFPSCAATLEALAQLKATATEADIFHVHAPSSATASEREAIKGMGGVPCWP
jgi:DNA-binding XRE family transcriptional regulator